MKTKKKKYCGILLGLALGLGLLFSGGTTTFADSVDVYTPLEVNGFDADVVADNGNWATGGNFSNNRYVDMTSNTHISTDGYGCVFISSQFNSNGAFPGGQTITTTTGKKFTLQSTTGNNVLQIARDEGFKSGRLTFPTPGK